MAVEKEKGEEVGPPMGEDTHPPHAQIFVRKNLFKREVYDYLQQKQHEQEEHTHTHTLTHTHTPHLDQNAIGVILGPIGATICVLF